MTCTHATSVWLWVPEIRMRENEKPWDVWLHTLYIGMKWGAQVCKYLCVDCVQSNKPSVQCFMRTLWECASWQTKHSDSFMRTLWENSVQPLFSVLFHTLLCCDVWVYVYIYIYCAFWGKSVCVVRSCAHRWKRSFDWFSAVWVRDRNQWWSVEQPYCYA